MSDNEITSDGDVQITIRQMHYMGEFSNWEGELVVKGEEVCAGMGPTFYGVLDLLTEYIWEQRSVEEHPVLDIEWFGKDSNAKS